MKNFLLNSGQMLLNNLETNTLGLLGMDFFKPDFQGENHRKWETFDDKMTQVTGVKNKLSTAALSAVPGVGGVIGGALSAMQQMAYGGNPMDNIGELEGDEVVIRPNSSIKKMKGPKHDKGGVIHHFKQDGEFVLSDRMGYTKEGRLTITEPNKSFAKVGSKLNDHTDSIQRSTLALIKAQHDKAKETMGVLSGLTDQLDSLKYAYGGLKKYAYGDPELTNLGQSLTGMNFNIPDPWKGSPTTTISPMVSPGLKGYTGTPITNTTSLPGYKPVLAKTPYLSSKSLPSITNEQFTNNAGYFAMGLGALTQLAAVLAPNKPPIQRKNPYTGTVNQGVQLASTMPLHKQMNESFANLERGTRSLRNSAVRAGILNNSGSQFGTALTQIQGANQGMIVQQRGMLQNLGEADRATNLTTDDQRARDIGAKRTGIAGFGNTVASMGMALDVNAKQKMSNDEFYRLLRDNPMLNTFIAQANKSGQYQSMNYNQNKR